MRAIKDKVKNPSLLIKRCVSAILGFMGFLSSIIAYRNYVLNEKNEINYLFLGLIIIFIFSFAAYTIIRFVKFRKEAEAVTSIFADSLHRINHLMKVSLFYLNYITQVKTTKKVVSVLYFSRLKEAIEIMSDTLLDLTDNKINISIKEIYCKGRTCTQNNTYVNTICESANSAHIRAKKDCLYKVIENPDFYSILFSDNEDFCVTDIKKYKRENEGIDKNWRKGDNSVIVVPIRIENENLGVDNGCIYDIIGFVEVETKAKKVFTKNNIDDYANYIKGCADIFYVHLKQYQKALDLAKG